MFALHAVKQPAKRRTVWRRPFVIGSCLGCFVLFFVSHWHGHSVTSISPSLLYLGSWSQAPTLPSKSVVRCEAEMYLFSWIKAMSNRYIWHVFDSSVNLSCTFEFLYDWYSAIICESGYHSYELVLYSTQFSSKVKYSQLLSVSSVITTTTSLFLLPPPLFFLLFSL